jgi:hypothetical protein
MTTRTIAESYASVKETYDHELRAQEKTNRSLGRLGVKVEQLFDDLSINNLQSVNPLYLENSIRELRVKLATLTARKVNFEALKEKVTEAMNFSTRDPIDETCFETICDLDPKLGKKITKLFNQAQDFNKELVKNHTHLKALARQNSRLMKDLNANIEKLNNHLENRGLCSWVAKKVCGWLDPQASVIVNPFIAPISNQEIVECELDDDYEETAPVAKKQTQAPVFIDLTDDDDEETAPIAEKQTQAPIFIDLTNDEKEEAPVVATPKDKKKETPVVEEQLLVAEEPNIASKSKKKAPAKEQAPAAVKSKASPKKRTRVVEKNTTNADQAVLAKKPRVNRELAGLEVTSEDLLKALQSTGRSTRSTSKK